jgi:diguanylate cyclase (GGDEF)-like protein
LRTLGVFGTTGVDAPWDVLGSPVSRRVLREGDAAVVQADSPSEPDEARLMREKGARTLLLLPLLANGRTIGLLELFSVAEVREFSAEELRFYRTMANQAGAGLDNVRLMEQLRQAADVDQLTGVNNHRYLQERLKQEAARSTRSHAPFSVLMVDLDGFKSINDKHGHADGDRVLRAVAAGLKLAVREHDIVARYGGDEFVVFMPDTDEPQARAVAKRVVAGVRGRRHELADGTTAKVSASAGLAVFPVDGRTPAALLRAADAAMYAIKRGGGSNVGRVTKAAAAALENGPKAR